MATLVTSLSNCEARMTRGERRFAERLRDKLENDYLCWYDVPIGARSRHPDFVVVHPRRGLLVIEVKDWRLETIQEANRHTATLVTSTGLRRVANPLEQARQHVYAVVDLLARDPALCSPPESEYAGKLALPYGYGVVLTNITRKAFESTDLGEVIDPHRVICRDEMTETVEAEALQTRLWQMFTVSFRCTLTMPQIDRIRWHMFPEIRIRQSELELEPAEAVATNIVRLMDLQQEQLARNLGDGHRIIHGPAGTGKTMILAFRCRELARTLHQPILVLCYNKALAARLKQLIATEAPTTNIVVRTFHGWCLDQLKLYHVARPAPGDSFFDDVVSAVTIGVERGQIPAAQYGAVMIDEGHDFSADWLKLAAQMVSPEINSLLVLYDDAQSIYQSRRQKFSFSSVGIQARGRTAILRLNYRNTAEILRVAHEFAHDLLQPQDADDDSIPVVAPESAGRSGPRPLLVRCGSLRGEFAYVTARLRELHAAGCAWEDMAILCRSRFVANMAAQALTLSAIPFEWPTERDTASFRSPDGVKLLTMHASKGLEFSTVVIPGVGLLPHRQADPTDEARLLYVAMTRATEHLILTHDRDSSFTNRLRRTPLQSAA